MTSTSVAPHLYPPNHKSKTFHPMTPVANKFHCEDSLESPRSLLAQHVRHVCAKRPRFEQQACIVDYLDQMIFRMMQSAQSVNLNLSNLMNPRLLRSRTKFVSWLLQAFDALQIEDQIFHRAVHLLDRFLSQTGRTDPVHADPANILTTGVAIVNTAFKVEVTSSITHPNTNTYNFRGHLSGLMAMMAHNFATIPEFHAREIQILNALSFKVWTPTVREFIEILSLRAGTEQILVDKPVKTLAYFLSELSMFHEVFWQYRPYTMAAACLTVATNIVCAEERHQMVALLADFRVTGMLNVEMFDELVNCHVKLLSWWIQALRMVLCEASWRASWLPLGDPFAAAPRTALQLPWSSRSGLPHEEAQDALEPLVKKYSSPVYGEVFKIFRPEAPLTVDAAKEVLLSARRILTGHKTCGSPESPGELETTVGTSYYSAGTATPCGILMSANRSHLSTSNLEESSSMMEKPNVPLGVLTEAMESLTVNENHKRGEKNSLRVAQSHNAKRRVLDASVEEDLCGDENSLLSQSQQISIASLRGKGSAPLRNQHAKVQPITNSSIILNNTNLTTTKKTQRLQIGGSGVSVDGTRVRRQ
eukprot:Platyproteum_vivax@DN4310_c0_g1_i1.p1